MPPLGAALSDEQVAGVVTYVRGAWEHTADPITVADVKKIRDEHNARTGAWTGGGSGHERNKGREEKIRPRPAPGPRRTTWQTTHRVFPAMDELARSSASRVAMSLAICACANRRPLGSSARELLLFPVRFAFQAATVAQAQVARRGGSLLKSVVKPKAGVAKLADALDSKSCSRKGVSVRPRPPVLLES